jgi:hypothetical protein
VAGFDGDAGAGGEVGQAGVEEGGVGTEGGGQLEQHRAQAVAQAGGVGHQAVYRFLGVAETLDVGEEAAGLDGDDEVGRGAGAPACECVAGGEAVEGVVDLHGGEVGGVLLQPTGGGEGGGIEDVPPVLVLPAGGADEEGHTGM